MKLAELVEKYLANKDVLAIRKYADEYLVMYHDKANACTPYIIHHMCDKGLYGGRYFGNETEAKEEF